MTADSQSVSNVVLITVDSLRPGAVGPYDDHRHTPVLDSLAETGTVFEHAFATGNWTPFSFPSLLASRPVFADSGRVGVTDVPTLAAVLSDADVSTAGFNAANGFLTSHWGYDDGFETFESFVASVGSNVYSRYLARHPTVEAWVQLATSPIRRVGSWLRGDIDDRPFLDTSRMFDVEHAATSFLDRAEEPFFLWVHYMDTHTPYVPAPRYIREVSSDFLGTHRMLRAHTRTALGRTVGERTRENLRTLYQAAARQVDASIGRLLDGLDDNGLAGETAVVVAGDHGEEFQEHGHLAHYPKLYDELIRVPLLVDVPGTPPRRVERQVGLDAVPSTVADLLGVDAPDVWTGSSLAPTVRDGTAPPDDPVVSVTVRGEEVTSQPIPRSLLEGDLLVSVRDQTWTYILNTETDAEQLYHRPSDPRQQTDCADDLTPERASVVDQFRPIADAHARMLTDENPSADTGEVDEDIEAQLDALGYT